MQKTKKNLNIYFENKDLTQNETYSLTIVKSLVRSVLEPIVNNNSKALIFTHLKEYDDIQGLIKRLEYCANVNYKKISDFELKSAYIRDILALKRQYIVFCKPIRHVLVAFCAKNLSIVSKDVENFGLACFT